MNVDFRVLFGIYIGGYLLHGYILGTSQGVLVYTITIYLYVWMRNMKIRKEEQRKSFHFWALPPQTSIESEQMTKSVGCTMLGILC